MKASRLKRKPKHLDNFTGLSVEQFELLSEAVEAGIAERKGTQGKPRQRATGGGRRAELNVEEQFLVMFSDLNVLRGTGVLRALPAAIHIRVDKGYDGIDKDFPERIFYQPAKARRNKPLDF